MFSENFGLIETDKERTLADIASEEGVFSFDELTDKEKGKASIRAHCIGRKSSDIKYFSFENGSYKKIGSEEDFFKYHNNIVIDEAKDMNRDKEKADGRFRRREVVFLGGKSHVQIEKILGDKSENYLIAKESRAGKISDTDYMTMKHHAYRNLQRGISANKGISFYNSDGNIGVKYHGN